MNLEEDLATINYFIERKLFNTARIYCDLQLKQKINDPILQFWSIFTLMMTGKQTEALREFQTIQEKRDLLLSCPIAMIYIHEKCKSIDHDSLEELQAKLTIASNQKSLTERQLLMAALFTRYIGKYDQSKQFLNQILSITPNYPMAECQLGMIDSQSHRESKNSKSIDYFEAVLKRSPKDINALMGKLQYIRKKRKNYQDALDISSKLMVINLNFIPVLTERMYIYIEMEKWEQALESAQRILAISPDSIDAMAVVALHELYIEGESKMATSYISNVYKVIVKVEPHSAATFLFFVRPFIRLSGRNAGVLEQCSKFLESALKISKKSEIKTEFAYLKELQGNILEATHYFLEATRDDPENVRALEGLTRCYINSKDFDHAEEHLDMFQHMSTGTQQSKSRMEKTAYLSSLIVWHKNGDAVKRIKYLKESIKTQIEVSNNKPMGFEYFVLVNPDFIDQVLIDFSENISPEPRKDGDRPDNNIPIIKTLAQLYCKIQPGSSKAFYNLARINFLSGDKQAAQQECSNCLRIDPTFSKGHILMSQIHLSNEHYKLAGQCLEMGLSYNFEVRNMPMFHIIKAKSLKMQGLYDDAMVSLNFALTLPGVKDSFVEGRGNKPSLSDRVSIFLECVDVQTRLKNKHEAAKLMEDTLREFSGTTEEVRINIANADFLVERGEIDVALQILSRVTTIEPLYIDAKSRMAEIYKTYKNDQRAYTMCYREIVEKSPSVKGWLLLGDAYMSIQEPEKSIAIYESALEDNPTATVLAMKIGKALVKTHNYKKAITYYEKALLTTNSNWSLRYDLADLYCKLKQYENAERVVYNALNHPKLVVDELALISQDVHFYSLLSKIYEAWQLLEKAIMSNQKARELQLHIVSRDTGNLENQENKLILAEICFNLAEQHLKFDQDSEKAMAYYNESIQQNATGKKALVALCNLNMSKGDLVAAQNVCATMLRMDLGTEDATMLMAEIMFKKTNYQNAIFHYQQLFEKNPNNYHALEKLIDMMRRDGKLEEVVDIFKTCTKGTDRYLIHAGYHYCKGLYFWYTGNNHEALSEFNQCRRDFEWSEKAIYNMIEISLNPENDTLGGDVLDSEGEDKDEKSEGNDVTSLLTADKLLKELPQSPPSAKTRVLECYAIMATKQKPDVEKALGKLMDILHQEKEFIPALLATAVAYMIQKQAPKARNQLKRISKMDWNPKFSDEFERSWLLLSDIYINGGKYDLARALLKEVLKYNRSSAKACEYMGFIMEKEASYKDAAEHYENAWKLSRGTNANMGYKLAFNYLKAGRVVDAIGIAHKVLAEFPDYPKIRKDILEKSRSCLRV